MKRNPGDTHLSAFIEGVLCAARLGRIENEREDDPVLALDVLHDRGVALEETSGDGKISLGEIDCGLCKPVTLCRVLCCLVDAARPTTDHRGARLQTLDEQADLPEAGEVT